MSECVEDLSDPCHQWKDYEMNSPDPVETNKLRLAGHDLAEHDPLLEYRPNECWMCGDTWCKCEELNYR